MQHWDVAVVGGGPAGAAAALAVLRQRPGTRVAILDAAEFPRDKPCGDGIAPQAVAELALLGVHGATDGYRAVNRLRLRAPGGTEAVGAPGGDAWVIPRTIFDARLHAAAVAAGAEPVQRRVRSLSQAGDAVVLGLGGGADAVTAGVVIGADGASSTVRRSLGLAANPPEHVALAVRGYADGTPGGAQPEQLVHMVADHWPSYAWAFPIGDGRSNVGFGMLVSRLPRAGRAALHGSLATLLPRLPADPATLRAHHLPLSTRRPPQPPGRVLLVGDAASLINPLTGEGIFYALRSGRLAGYAAATALAGGSDGAAAGAMYGQALHRNLGRHLRHTALLARATRSQRLVEGGIEACRRSPGTFALLAELGLGEGIVPPALLPRVVRGLLRAAQAA